MLQSIRERAQGWIAWIIVGLIIFVFAIWGIHNFFTPDAEVVVVKVDDTEVTLREFQAAYQQQRERLRSLLGDRFDAASLSDDIIKRQVVSALVDNIVLVNAARDAGFRIGDAQVSAEIRSIPAFDEDGKFSRARYEQALRNAGMSPGLFEQRMRADLLTSQLRSGLVRSALVTPAELSERLRLEGQQREIAYLTIPASRYKEGVEISDKEIEDYYRAHQAEFAVPEKVIISYIELSTEAIASRINPDDAELRKLYEQTAANYRQDERRRASHILIAVPQDADQKKVEEARTKAEDLRKQLDSGASFDELAKKYSEDQGSADKGGDLGFFARGQMVKPFEDAVFSMKKGEISQPVRSPFGFHIIKLTDIDPARQKTFEEARPLVLQEYRRTHAEQQFYEQSETLANLTYEHPDTLEPAAQALGVKVKTAGPFPRSGGTGVAANPKVVAAAFSDDVLGQGNNSDPVDLGNNDVVVLRVKEHIPAKTRPLAEVRDEIVGQLRSRGARTKARAVGEKLLSQLREGKSQQEVAKEADAQWQRPGFVGRNDAALPPSLVAEAFRLPRPAAKGPAALGGVTVASGDYAILEVKAVKDGETTSTDKAASEAKERELTQAAGSEEFQAFLNSLKQRAKIVVHQDRL